MECFHGVLGKDPPLDPSAQWQGTEADLIGQSLPWYCPAGGERETGREWSGTEAYRLDVRASGDRHMLRVSAC